MTILTDKNPPVSIVVITYNSSAFVLETLESAKNQTYRNIELIISDDASQDDTVEICQQWLKKNKERFLRTEVVTVKENTGIPANCNRGAKASSGEWVKLIGGDDLLLQNCIEDNMRYAVKNSSTFIVSEVLEFIGTFKTTKNKWICTIPQKFLKTRTPKEQFLFFLSGNGYLPGSAFFINKSLLSSVGWFEESYKSVEDRPLLLKITFNDLFIYKLEKITVAHRRHSAGLTNKKSFPYYLLDVFKAVITFSKLSGQGVYLFNGYWHYYILNLQTKISYSVIERVLNYIRVHLQPIRLLRLKDLES